MSRSGSRSSSIGSWGLQRLNISGEVYELCSGATVVGRSPIASITLSSSTVSRLHCRFSVSNDSRDIFVEDLNSGNGTYINQERIKENAPFTLNLNDNIGIGTPVNSRVDTLKPEDQYHFKLIRIFKKPQEKIYDFIDLTETEKEIKLEYTSDNEFEIDYPIIENKMEDAEVADEENNEYPVNFDSEDVEDDAFETPKDKRLLQYTINKLQQTAKKENGIKLLDVPDIELREYPERNTNVETMSKFKSPISQAKGKRKYITSKSQSAKNNPITSQNNKVLRDIRKKKLKEIALRNKEKESAQNPYNDSQCEIKLPTIDIYNTVVSKSNKLVLNTILYWNPKWLMDSMFTSKIPPITLGSDCTEKIVEYYTDCEHYKRAYVYVISLHIWNSIKKGYAELKKPLVYQSSKLLHSLDKKSFGTVRKIHLFQDDNSSKSHYNPGDILVLRFNWIICFAIVRKQILEISKDMEHLELYVNLPSYELFVNSGSAVTYYKLSNISNELHLLHSVYGLQNAPLCDLIVSPKYQQYPITNYIPTDLINNLLDQQQINVLSTVIGSLKTYTKSMNIVSGSHGTGKTFTLCYIVGEYILAGTDKKKILISAPTDIGVGNLVNQFSKMQNHLLEDLELKCVVIVNESESMFKSIKKNCANTYMLENILYPTNEKDFQEAKDNLKDANIIFTTIFCCAKLKKLLKDDIFWCLVDDASCVYEPEVLSVICLDVRHLTLFGDMYQTPFKSSQYPHLFASKNNGSLFSRICSLVSTWEQNIVLLMTTQHRMDSSILKVSELISNKIKCGPLQKELLKSPILKYCVFGLESNSFGGTPVVNDKSVARIALAILSIMSNHIENITVTVLMENSAHLDHFLTSLNILNHPRAKEIRMSTVENFQGEESDIVLVNMKCDKTDVYHSALIIALTRAKFCLYLFGDRNFEKNSSSWRAIIEDARRKHQWKIIPYHISQHPVGTAINKDPDIIRELLVNS